MRSVLYFSDASVFEAARDVLIRNASLVSASHPSLLVSSLGADSSIISGMHGATILTDPLPEKISRRMPEDVRQAAMVLVMANVAASRTTATGTTATESDGIAWDAPGYDAPGRPRPGE
jgi:hypothetical protein